MNDHDAFKQLLWDIVRQQFQTQDALATALRMDPGHLNRAMSRRGAYPFSLENCLRLADVAHVSPRTVLRAAAKSEVDLLIQRLYGRPRLSDVDEALLTALHAIDDEAIRRHVVTYVKALAKASVRARTSGVDPAPARGAAAARPGAKSPKRRARKR